MKKLIIAASIALFSASAFAANTSVPQQTAMDTSTQQKHTYSVISQEGREGAITKRNARMQRNEMDRSDNAKKSWAGSAHYY
ncbi:MAG: hypothetical protein NTX21_04275 [Alphaproteobacteria bacterium]|nr:hypothetical protein [Alphaproteobacteria bacterium]